MHLGWRESISAYTSQTIFSVHEKCKEKVYPKRESCVHMGQTFSRIRDLSTSMIYQYPIKLFSSHMNAM